MQYFGMLYIWGRREEDNLLLHTLTDGLIEKNGCYFYILYNIK